MLVPRSRLSPRVSFFFEYKKSNLGNANQHFLQIQCTLLLAAPPPLPSPPLPLPLPGSTYIHYPWTILTGKHRETRIAGTYLQVQVGRYVSVVVRNHTNDAHTHKYDIGKTQAQPSRGGVCVVCCCCPHLLKPPPPPPLPPQIPGPF